MATREVVTLTCDVCGVENDGVTTHTISVDGKAAEVETCSKHWEPFAKRVGILFEAGRRPRKGRRVRA